MDTFNTVNTSAGVVINNMPDKTNCTTHPEPQKINNSITNQTATIIPPTTSTDNNTNIIPHNNGTDSNTTTVQDVTTTIPTADHNTKTTNPTADSNIKTSNTESLKKTNAATKITMDFSVVLSELLDVVCKKHYLFLINMDCD